MNQNFRKFSFDREFLVMRNLALSFYSLKHLLSHYNYLSLPILVLSFLNRTILKLFFLTIMLIFICLFMKSSFFSYKFQDIVERLDQKRSNRLQRNNYSNENFQTKSFLKKIYDRIFKRKTTKIKSLADEYNVNISLPSLPQKSSISYPPLPHFETDNKPIKIKILFQKLKKIICEFLKPKKPFSNPTNPYIKKLIIQTKIEEKSKASDKITAIVNPNPKKEHPNQNQIYRISKKRSSLSILKICNFFSNFLA